MNTATRWATPFAVVVFLVWPTGLFAQGPAVPEVDVSPTLIQFPTPMGQDFLQGFVPFPGGVQVNVRTQGVGNPWRLYLVASEGQFQPTGKPRGDVQWRHSGSEWTTLESVQEIAAGQGPSTLLLDVRTLMQWAHDSPGVGALQFSFVVLRPNESIESYDAGLNRLWLDRF